MNNTPARPTIAQAILLPLALASLVGCDSRSGQEPKSQANATAPTILSTAIISDPKTFNPLLVTDEPSNKALGHVFEGLVRRDPLTLDIEPHLAERWEVSDDGKQWTFHLRKDVRWHDGEPFTADDVVFTFDAVFHDKVANSAKHVLEVDGQAIQVAAVDAYTVRFSMPRPFAPFLAAVGIEILPEHVLAEALKAGTFAQQWGIDTPPGRLVGTGPYRMTQYEPAQFARYARNDDYWARDGERALPFLEGRTMLIVPDQNALYLKFLAKQTHIHLPRPEEVSDLQSKAAAQGIRVKELGISTSSQFITFNRNPKAYSKGDTVEPKLAWFTDRQFLQAIAHAVDKEAMVLNCLSGYGEAAVGRTSPSDKVFFHPELTDYEYDLERAEALLRDAGFVERDGRLHDRDGHRVEFSLTTNAGNKIREKMASILKEDWAKLGIQVNYRPVDFTTLVEKLDQTFDWDVIVIGFTATPEPNNGANLLRSSGNLHMWHPSQETPATDWEREVDDLLTAGTKTLDLDKRVKIYRRIQEILHRELPMIQTVRAETYVAYDQRLQNFEMSVWDQRRPERLFFAP